MKYGIRLYHYKSPRRRKKARLHIFAMIAAAAAFGAFFTFRFVGSQDHYAKAAANLSEAPVPFSEPVVAQAALKTAQAVGSTEPAAFGMSWEVMKNGNIVSQYSAAVEIGFPSSSFSSQNAKYTELEGVTTFRGNNYRNARPTAQPMWRRKTWIRSGPSIPAN